MSDVARREGQVRSEESYAKLEDMYNNVLSQRVPEGQDAAEKEFRKDPLYCAKKVVEDLMKLLELESEEYKLSPQELIFVSELIALNVQRAQNCPLSPERVEKIKARARKYYEDGIQLLNSGR